MPPSNPQFSRPVLPIPHLCTCLPAPSHFSPLCALYLLQSWRPTCHLQTCWFLMAVGAFPTTPAASRMPDGLRGEQREGLSGTAGLPSITMPIETAAPSPALRSQIRPPDRAAQRRGPSLHNGWDRPDTATWPTTLTALPTSHPLCFPQGPEQCTVHSTHRRESHYHWTTQR